MIIQPELPAHADLCGSESRSQTTAFTYSSESGLYGKYINHHHGNTDTGWVDLLSGGVRAPSNLLCVQAWPLR